MPVINAFFISALSHPLRFLASALDRDKDSGHLTQKSTYDQILLEQIEISSNLPIDSLRKIGYSTPSFLLFGEKVYIIFDLASHQLWDGY